MRGWATLAVVCATLAPGCFSSSEQGVVDASVRDAPSPLFDAGRRDAGPRCRTDAECSDGLFCTGVERCEPRDSRADAFGCVAGAPACSDSLVCTVESDPPCDEAAARCHRVVLDHARCPAGFFCRRTWGCTEAMACPADGTACALVGPDDGCHAARCDTSVSPPRCVTEELADDTPCTTRAGMSGVCISGECLSV